jgi:primosomal protein N' (replication factor Y) (superfamily II helicase)
MENLFGETLAPPVRPAGPVAVVAVEQAIDRDLDYSIPTKLVKDLAVGQRVRVPLGRGNKSAFGYVVQLRDHSEYKTLKPIEGVDDSRTLIIPEILELARWMSRYYCTPLGTVLESVIPSAVKKRIGLRTQWIVRAGAQADLVAALAKVKNSKRRAIVQALMAMPADESMTLDELAEQAGTSPATVRKLADSGLLHLTREHNFGFEMPEGPEHIPLAGHELTIQQQAALDQIIQRIDARRFSVTLLHGVTGSGKTEVYLRAIGRIVEKGQQAIVLVPEISLTPQTARRFTERFPKVAVLHSGLTATDRHWHWRRIASGEAQVVVGARSAVFAPMPNLGLIIIDEEHEGSYKQETAPRYHARDVAIKRAHTLGIPVVLGSATPSLEMYYRARSGSAQRQSAGAPAVSGTGESAYYYLTLDSRVTANPLPKVELVDLRDANRGRPGVHMLTPYLEQSIGRCLEAGHQVILLLNRRGYASYVCCSSCKEPIQCPYCAVSMTYHRHEGMHGSARAADSAALGDLRCHYCLNTSKLPATCPTCGKKLSLFGLGTQRVEEELERKFPGVVYARMDSDTMRQSSDYERVLGEFAAGRIKILTGTQMIAKGLDFPNVTLVGVISGDTALMLPDFRAAERTFQLITQVAGRAGRGDQPGLVIVQTFMPQDPTIQAATRHDYEAFANRELQMRREVHLPPFSRMARIVLREQDAGKLEELSKKIGDELQTAAKEIGDITIQGPTPCPIGRISGYFRNQIQMYSPLASNLQKLLAVLRKHGSIMRGDRIAIDVDPISLL